MAAVLLCHVQNVVVISVSVSLWKQNEISIEFESVWKILSEPVSQVTCLDPM